MDVDENPNLQQNHNDIDSYFEQNWEKSKIIQPKRTHLSQCNFTIYPSNAITHAVAGYFISSDQVHVAVARGNILGIMEANYTAENLRTLYSWDVLGVISNLKAFHIQEINRDAILLTSNSGKLIIIKYYRETNSFNKTEYIYTSPCRGPNISAPHLVTDVKGRAIFLGPITGKVILLHKILNKTEFSEVMLDMSGYKIFFIVSLYSRTDQMEFIIFRQRTEITDVEVFPFELISYQYGENKKLESKFELFSEYIDLLVPVPYNSTSPGGVMLFSKNKIIYQSLNSSNSILEFWVIGRKHEAFLTKYGEYSEENDVTFSHATEFFMSPHMLFFAQTTEGEIYAFCLWKNSKNELEDIKFVYLDTLPMTNTLCIVGQLLFVASKFSNHFLFRIPEKSDFFRVLTRKDTSNRNEFKKLMVVDVLPNFFPTFDFQVAESAEKNSQIYLICGSKNQSSLRCVIQGFQVLPVFEAKLPIKSITGVWMCQYPSIYVSHRNKALLFVSSQKRTYCFEMTAMNAREFELKKLTTEPDCYHLMEQFFSLTCSSFGERGIIQITPSRINFFCDGVVSCLKEFKKSRISKCAVNEYNFLIYCEEDGSLEYYRFVSSTNVRANEYSLNSYRPITLTSIPQVLCFAIGKVRECNKSPVIAIATPDKIVYLAYFDGDKEHFSIFHKIQLMVPVKSMVIINAVQSNTKPVETNGKLEYDFSGSLDYLFIGLKNGNLLRCKLCKYSTPADTLVYTLGTKPVKLFQIQLWNTESVLAVSSKKWLCYFYQGQLHMSPLDFDVPLKYVMMNCPKRWQNCIVTVDSDILQILTLPKFEHNFVVAELWLTSTPHKLVMDRTRKKLLVIEREPVEHESKPPKNLLHVSRNIYNSSDCGFEFNDEATFKEWNSYIEIVDITSWQLLKSIPLSSKEGIFSACILNFPRTEDIFIIGGAKSIDNKVSGIVYIYRILSKGSYELELIGTMCVDDIPKAMCNFKEKLLIAEGNILALYKFETNLKKIQKIELFDKIVTIDVCPKNDSILIGHASHNISILRLTESLEFSILLEDHSEVSITSAIFLNDTQYALADRLGNFLVASRGEKTACCESLVEDVVEDITKLYDLTALNTEEENFQFFTDLVEDNWEERIFTGTYKMKIDSKFYIGEPIIKMQLVKLHCNAKPCLLYMTTSGRIGVLVNASKCAGFLLNRIQKKIAAICPPLSGHEFEVYRSCYGKIKNVIDGDFCTQFFTLSEAQQCEIASKIGCSVNEITAGLEELKLHHSIFT